MSFSHTPVLLDEILELLRELNPRLVIDCTLGGAGHARAILEQCPLAHLIGLDRDADACSAARANLSDFADRSTVLQERFSAVADVLQGSGHSGADAILVDLGVSSHQLDKAERGFAFRFDGPLDMRMNQSIGRSAAQLIDELSEDALREVIRDYGEERHARAIARTLKREVPQTTSALANIVRAIVPQGKSKVDPATRTFQGLRIQVNQEMSELEEWLGVVPEVLNPGGLVLAIAYHSLEDRPVKRAFRQYAKGCICPANLPACACGITPTLKLVTRKPIRPSDEEISRNPRARSAKLRVAKRLGD
ncbi:MAG: 16S rRNA (cytosine(1402)-N(4))-methyltransferase RsmH [Myxococcota bacterium]|nr:16S rRNA (cytosine(1402)-N(4))-methyltransferase RsmH [Myxococcota bacterium]